MAKNDTKKTEETTTAAGAALATIDRSALASMLEGLDVGDGGLGEIGNEDIKVAVKVFNFKGTDAAGDPIPPNVFYDTIQETTSKTLDLTLLDLHKSNEWREYDEAEGVSKRRCASTSAGPDAMGTMEDGSTRPCLNCPDAKWTTVQLTTGKTKRTRRCGPVYALVAKERPSGEPCLVRFKKTSLPVIQAHLNKHHLGKLALGGGRRADVPLFSLQVRASLKMSDDKKYALPVLEVVGQCTREEVEANVADARFYRERVRPILEQLAAKDQDGGGAPDTSFNPDEFGGGEPVRGPQNGDRFADDRAR